MEDKILEFINSNWEKTIYYNDELPFPYSAPNTNMYSDFYYWDLYFINKGLLASGLVEQAENNVADMAFFVNKLGYIPNANYDVLRFRTQPPVFTLCVWDLFEYTKDKGILEKYIDVLLKEHNFFQERRMTKIGLNAYMCDDKYNSYEVIMNHYKYLSPRVYEYSDDENRQYEIGRDIIAVAESGLDFNPRFKTEDRLMAASEFAHLDLNCWLYAVEVKLAEMLSILNRNKEAELMRKTFENRKELINKYFLNKENGIYLDYRFTNNTHSEVITAVSLYPYAMGISNDKESALKVLKYLELDNGVSAGMYRDVKQFYQWDYPTMWGETALIVYLALKNVGAIEDTERIKNKYMKTVEKQFAKTGLLWEKYDARTGDIMNVEYDAPSFLGWTAATYELFALSKDSDHPLIDIA